MEGSENGKAVVNLTSGAEDPEAVALAFIVATTGLAQGKQVTMFLTKEAARIGLSGHADGIEAPGLPAVAGLFETFREHGGRLFACTVCFNARDLNADELVGNAELAGPTPLWQWMDEGTPVFSY